jgi:hypothetical protein
MRFQPWRPDVIWQDSNAVMFLWEQYTSVPETVIWLECVATDAYVRENAG